MHVKTSLTYNPWFLLPFMIWMISGGAMLATYNAEEMFRAVNTRHTETLDWLMYWITDLGNGWPIGVILGAIALMPGFRNWWFVLSAVLCMVVPSLLVQGIKGLYSAPRPLAMYEGQAWVHILKDWHKLYDNSFPSGHSSGAFSLCCFLSLLLPRKWAPVGLLLFCVAVAVGYSRMYLAAHFFKDVYVGSLIGTVTTMAMYRMERELHGRFFRTGPAEQDAAS